MAERKLANRVTIFSNGIADFVRHYSVKDKMQISIPVRKNHVGDMLASLNLFGDAKLVSPPSFRPSNDDDGNLQLGTGNVFEELATQLSGSKVEVTQHGGEKIKGTLVGIQSEENANAGQKFLTQYVVVSTDAGIVKASFKTLKELVFLEESVKSEISKALQRNFQQVKPNSTFVELSVESSKPSDAIVQYTIPSAAWKISYRLNDDGSNVELKGLAIVDNNTDEDWNDVIVSVVTGEPITFSTDLAESKVPARNHINVVKDRAVGAVEVEQGFLLESAPVPSVMAKSLARGGRSMSLMSCSAAAGSSALMDSDDEFQPASAPYGGSAMNAAVEAKEIGDFSIFTSKDAVTIASNRSAVIPVFDADLKESRTILHYKIQNHPERPFRSMQFKNETPHSLGRGVCTMYQNGIYSGSCILPATKQGEEQLLPYALETGVRIKSKSHGSKRKIGNLKITKGVSVSEDISTATTDYTIANSKDEAFEVYIDHNESWHNRLGQSAVAIVKRGNKEEKVSPAKSLDNGSRFVIKLAPKEQLTMTVTETVVSSSTVELGFNSYSWFHSQFIANDGPLASSEELVPILETFEALAEISKKINAANSRRNKQENKADRLRKNLGVAGQDAASNAWRSDLSKCEAEITKIDEVELPGLDKQREDAEAAIDKALRTLTIKSKA